MELKEVKVLLEGLDLAQLYDVLGEKLGLEAIRATLPIQVWAEPHKVIASIVGGMKAEPSMVKRVEDAYKVLLVLENEGFLEIEREPKFKIRSMIGVEAETLALLNPIPDLARTSPAKHGEFSVKTDYLDCQKSKNLEFLNLLGSIAFRARKPAYSLLKKDGSPLSKEAYDQTIKLQREVEERFAEIEGIPIYFQWFYDQRGRSYSVGTYFNPQGDSSFKASLEFYEGQIVTGDLDESLGLVVAIQTKKVWLRTK